MCRGSQSDSVLDRCALGLLALLFLTTAAVATPASVDDWSPEGPGPRTTGQPELPEPAPFVVPTDAIPLPLPIAPEVNPAPVLPQRLLSFDLATRSLVQEPSGVHEVTWDPTIGNPGPDAEGEHEPPLRNFTDLELIANPELAPWRMNVKLFLYFTDQNGTKRTFVGSGALIDPSHVITAGHCLYQHDEDFPIFDWADSVIVVPGYEWGNEPYGYAKSTQLHSWSGWVQDEDFDSDNGVIDLDRPVGALTGWFGYDWDSTCSFYTGTTFHSPGYPDEIPYNGEEMYYYYGTFDLCPPLSDQRVFYHDSFAGQSGSGAYAANGSSRTVYSVLSNASSLGLWTAHAIITSSRFSDITSVIDSDTPSSPDLVAMDVQISPESVESGEQLSSMTYLIHNYSATTWSGSVSGALYLSTNSIISTADQFLQNSNVSSLTLLPKSSIRINVGSPPTIPSSADGDYYVGVLLSVSDANSGNNASNGQEAAAIHVDPAPDTSPPSPNPLTWSMEPEPTSTTSVAMQATSASDDSPPVQYEFDFVTGGSGGTDRTWSSASSYTDGGLGPNDEYSYRVRARDSAAPTNTGAYSATRSTYTHMPAPTGVDVTLVSEHLISIAALGSFPNLTESASGLYFDSTTPGGDVGLNEWKQTNTDQSFGLTENTQYVYRIKARNGDGIETAWSTPASVTTYASKPPVAELSSPTETTITVDPSAGSNPSYTELAIRNETLGYYVSADGSSSGGTPVWRTDADWGAVVVSSLSPAQTYCFVVFARNLEGAVTLPSDPACLSTACTAPLEAPASLDATDDLCDRILVSWSFADADQDGFRVWRDGSPVLAGADPAQRTWDDFDAPEGSHQYVVAAYNACGGDGPSSDATNGTRLVQVTTAPGNVVASDDLCESVAVSWTWSGTGQNGFEISRDGVPIYTGNEPNERDWLDASAVPGTTYEYEVRGYNDACGVGPPSATDDGTRSVCEQVWYVRQDGSGDATTIQGGIDLAAAGDTVRVAAGTYFENVSFRSKAIVLESESGRDATVIDGSALTAGADSGSVVRMGAPDPGAVLRGFTITNGSGGKLGMSSLTWGGGILCHPDLGAKSLVEDCVVTGNGANEGGGVSVNTYTEGQIRDCVISQNTANAGGGVYVNQTYASMSWVIEGCVIADNSGLQGSGLKVDLARPEIAECTLVDNHGGGAGIQILTSIIYAPTVRNTIVAFTQAAAGLQCSGPGDPPLFSCNDVYGNLDDTICGIDAGDNFAADPQFCDRPGGDYTLRETSPCLPPNNSCSTLIGSLGQGCTGLPPFAVTEPASSVTSVSALLNGTVNPNGQPTDYYFEWGPSPSYGNATSPASAGSGSQDVTVSEPIAGLAPATPYHYRVVASSAGGEVQGQDATFTTLDADGLWYVRADGSGETPTIQAAIDASSPGDVIYVEAGTYAENLVLAPDRELRGSYDSNFQISDVMATPSIIDATGLGSGIVADFGGTQDSTGLLSGFKVVNGTGTDVGGITYGGGIFCVGLWDIEDVVVESGEAEIGGGIAIVSNKSSIRRCRVADNVARSEGGGIFLSVQDYALLEHCVVAGNDRSSLGFGEFRGGGVSANGGLVEVRFTTIDHNGGSYACPPNTTYGRGIGIYATCDSLIVLDSTVESNGCGLAEVSGGSTARDQPIAKGGLANSKGSDARSAQGDGGGIYVGRVRLERCVVADNEPPGGSDAIGGGLYVQSAWLLDCDVLRNGAPGGDGPGFGGGIYGGTLTIENCRVHGNWALAGPTTARGGGIYADSLKIRNTSISGNRLDSGGTNGVQGAGLFVQSHLDALNIVVHDNRGWAFIAPDGIGVSVGPSGDGSVVNSAIVGNIVEHGAPPESTVVGLSGPVSSHYNLFFGNNGLNVGGTADSSGHVYEDPNYADASAYDYHLLLHSPAIDAGDPTILDPDGSRSDIGVFGGPNAAFEQPVQVTGVAAGAGPRGISLGWDEPANGQAIAVYGSAAAGFVPGIGSLLGTTEEASFLDRFAFPGDSRFYRVSAFDDSGWGGGYSTEIEATAVPFEGEDEQIDLSLPGAYLDLEGATSGARLGRALARADLNGDQIDDLVIGAREGTAFVVYVFWGGSFAPDPSAPDLIVYGPSTGEGFGGMLVSGDFVGDATEDLAIGASVADPAGRQDAGAVYVITGSPNLEGVSQIDLSTSAPQLTVQGAEPGDGTPSALAAGDVDGDGKDDLILGTESRRVPPINNRDGEVTVIFGSTGLGGTIDLATACPGCLTIHSDPAGLFSGDRLGSSAGSADVNGDQIDDLILGSRSEDPGDLSSAGAVHVILGYPGLALEGTRELATVPADLVLEGAAADDQLGVSAGSGDVDGDGTPEILAGAWSASGATVPDAGRAYAVKFGDVPSGVLSLGDETSWLQVLGRAAGDSLGSFVISAPVPPSRGPLVVAAPRAFARAGAAYVFWGGNRFPGFIDLAQSAADVEFLGPPDSGGSEPFLGSALAVGDFNGNGTPDIVVGAYGADPGGRQDAGIVVLEMDHDPTATPDLPQDGGDVGGIALGPPVPNPSTGHVAFELAIGSGQSARLVIYDVRGRMVWRSPESYSEGHHAVEWVGVDRNGHRLPSGVYFSGLQGAVSTKRKFVILR